MIQPIINVTKSYLPNITRYKEYLDKIWQNEQLTNQGPFIIELENQLKQFLGVSNFQFVTNGTIALQVALRALDITEGDIITTPFSYVATTSAILWERCNPIFVDINPDTFCIDADKIEKAITQNTKAILAVHVFGYPCDVEKIEQIALKYNLKVIYDAAHAFGVRYKEKSLLDYGDISTGSFHATKVFHTIEGGCVIAQDKEISDKIGLIKNFGHFGYEHYTIGINAKASEFQAIMGLCNLEVINKIIKQRKDISITYDQHLNHSIQRPLVPKNFEYNYAYYPAIFKDNKHLLATINHLNKENIYPRRYFYPSLNTLPYLIGKPQSCPISEDICSRILCLPLYVGLDIDTVLKICNIINNVKVEV